MSAALRVLIPSDDSDPSRRAVAHVLSLAARGLLLDIHVLNVQTAVRGTAASLVPPQDLESFHRDEGMRALAESIRQIETTGLKAHAHVSVGDPADVILAFAERLHCEQIVMGTRGRGLVSTLLLGSVAQHVVVHATLPVTLVR